jgi:hypothetical protein
VKEITLKEYKKKMNKIINLNLKNPIDEAFMALLDEASKYRIVDVNKTREKIVSKSRTAKRKGKRERSGS